MRSHYPIHPTLLQYHLPIRLLLQPILISQLRVLHKRLHSRFKSRQPRERVQEPLPVRMQPPFRRLWCREWVHWLLLPIFQSMLQIHWHPLSLGQPTGLRTARFKCLISLPAMEIHRFGKQQCRELRLRVKSKFLTSTIRSRFGSSRERIQQMYRVNPLKCSRHVPTHYLQFNRLHRRCIQPLLSFHLQNLQMNLR